MFYHHRIMPRTTVDIDLPLLKELKRLQKREKKSLGRLVSDLLARALADERVRRCEPRTFEWISRPMGLLVDLTDKDALEAALAEDTKLP